MSTECQRIVDQLRRAFDGEAWHGPALRELLAGVTPEQAGVHPLPNAHSIWELVLHIEVWTRAAFGATQGKPMPEIVNTAEDWPVVRDGSSETWKDAQARLFDAKDQLASAIEKFEDARLAETVPGRTYDFYYLFHGVIQHSLYHGGQIALLKKTEG